MLQCPMAGTTTGCDVVPNPTPKKYGGLVGRAGTERFEPTQQLRGSILPNCARTHVGSPQSGSRARNLCFATRSPVRSFVTASRCRRTMPRYPVWLLSMSTQRREKCPTNSDAGGPRGAAPPHASAAHPPRGAALPPMCDAHHPKPRPQSDTNNHLNVFMRSVARGTWAQRVPIDSPSIVQQCSFVTNQRRECLCETPRQFQE